MQQYFQKELANTTIYSVTYPTRFMFTLPQIIDYIEKALLHIVKRYDDSRIYGDKVQFVLSGYSAGAYFASHILNKSAVALKIQKFIGINGYYGSKTVKSFLIKLLDSFYLRELTSIRFNHIPIVRNPTAIFACKNDFLLESSINYSSFMQIMPFVYDGDHKLFTNYESSLAKKFYSGIVTEINSIKGTTTTLKNEEIEV